MRFRRVDNADHRSSNVVTPPGSRNANPTIASASSGHAAGSLTSAVFRAVVGQSPTDRAWKEVSSNPS